MAKVIVCTVCSKDKDLRPGLIPARQRYLGSQIAHVAKIGHDSGLPFYILSGKLGPISADELIGLYDYLLEETEVDALAGKIIRRLELEKITKVIFFYKSKPGWRPYAEAMRRAAYATDTTLHTVMLALQEAPTLSPA